MNSDYIQEDIRLINLYSQSATSYLNGTLKSNVSFNFKNILRDEKDIIYSTIGVTSAQIPVSYYTINEYNNVLITDNGIMTIPVGNYNATSLRTTLTTLFTTLGYTGVSVTISASTGKLSISSNIELSFDYGSGVLTSTAYDILGFTEGYYSTSGYETYAPLAVNVVGLTAVTTSNNTLITTDGILKIPIGNYSISSLINTLIIQITALGTTQPVITLNTSTNKLTFRSYYGINLIYTSGVLTSTAYGILGFVPTNNYPSSASPVIAAITAPNPLNLLGNQQLRINSAAFACSNSNSTTMGESNLVGVIQSTAAPFGMILYSNQTSYSVLKSKNISLIDIQILDENGNYVDFNNIDWTLTFQLTIFRRIPLPSNSTDYLRPILATLNTIQQDLENNPPAVDSNPPQNPPPDNTPAPIDNTPSNDFLNDDSNSLDIMSYNKQLPS